MSMWIRFLAVFPSGTLRKLMAGSRPSGDQRRAVLEVVVGLVNVSEGQRPEGREPLGVRGVTANSPMCRHVTDIRLWYRQSRGPRPRTPRRASDQCVDTSARNVEDAASAVRAVTSFGDSNRTAA
jgi:hypothetical protein